MHRPLKRDIGTVPVKGERIKELRKAKGLSQKELSARARVSRRTIQGLEKGNAAFPTTIGPIAAFFGIDRDTLIDGPAPKLADKSPDDEWETIILKFPKKWQNIDETMFLPKLIKLFYMLRINEVLLIRVQKGCVEVVLEFPHEIVLSKVIPAFDRNLLPRCTLILPGSLEASFAYFAKYFQPRRLFLTNDDQGRIVIHRRKPRSHAPTRSHA